MGALRNIVLIYFVLGAVMFGGGAITFDNSGVTQFFIEQEPTGVAPGDQPNDKLSGLAGAITSLVGEFGGGTVLIWNLVVGLFGFMNWPIVVLLENHAPPSVIILLGGSLTASFYLAVVGLVKTS